MADLDVEIREPDADIAPDWRDLVGRAPANVFVDPVGLEAVRESGFAEPLVLLAWDNTVSPAKLVGLMALRARRAPGLLSRHFCSLPHDYAFISSPVIDPAYAGDVVPAFFAEIARRPDLPKVIRFEYLDGSEPSYDAIRSALDGPATQSLALRERERAYATRESGAKRSGATRKKLRQDWNRLSATGTVDVVNERKADAALAALEIFLTMEAAGWKGDKGTAFLSNARDTAFVRAFVAALAAAGNASVALLRVNGTPIAAQVLFYAGAKAYTWKIAFDAAYGRFSPGVLLVDKVTEMLFDSGGTTEIESCSPEGGFMDRMWDGRRTTVDLLVGLAPRKSLTFHAVAAEARARAWLKAARDRLRRRQWPWQSAKAVPADAPRESSGKVQPSES
jgi:CelD/BcsL family acetyltransferase involved in cellulose biosynthesis